MWAHVKKTLTSIDVIIQKGGGGLFHLLDDDEAASESDQTQGCMQYENVVLFFKTQVEVVCHHVCV